MAPAEKDPAPPLDQLHLASSAAISHLLRDPTDAVIIVEIVVLSVGLTRSMPVAGGLSASRLHRREASGRKLPR
jgi:hypothetical protein